MTALKMTTKITDIEEIYINAICDKTDTNVVHPDIITHWNGYTYDDDTNTNSYVKYYTKEYMSEFTKILKNTLIKEQFEWVQFQKYHDE